MKKDNEMRVFALAARMLKSVAHPVRIEIINYLIKMQKVSVNDLKDKLKITQSMTSQHLAVLKNVGIVDCDKQANVCYYFIRNKNILKLLDCVERCAKEHLI
ncbi:MAG: helix-turn-helix transcriptional regulator [Candidatus Omnitrophica bacterium]|nr:helix-turn-helix transcriptional regulator [Candidatus Omnitrophota bacterium]MCB9748040.1 helix-turn-helix transcriptional regulator [Candidatus Omnitrophota bacterium]